jgi:hypothetical protein
VAYTELMREEEQARKERLDAAVQERRVVLLPIDPEMLVEMFRDHGRVRQRYHFRGLPEDVRVIGAHQDPHRITRDSILLHVASPAFAPVPQNQMIPVYYDVVSIVETFDAPTGEEEERG